MNKAKTSNHAQAPLSARFVADFRKEFGGVTVLYVNENGLVLGEPSDHLAVPVTFAAPDDKRAPVLAKKAA